MPSALPVKLQNDLKQFQRLQQDLAALSQQHIQMDLKLRETRHTLEELQSLATDAVVYRPIGAFFIRAKDRQEVTKLLEEEKELLEVRLKAVERQENGLKERYTTMQQDITRQIQVAGLATTEESTLTTESK